MFVNCDVREPGGMAPSRRSVWLRHTPEVHPGKRWTLTRREVEWLSMNQTAVAYLLTATMLTCPYACLGNKVRGPVAARTPQCCCCGDESSLPGGDLPEKRDGTRSDCLCHGAIVDGAKVTVPWCVTHAEFAGTIDIASQAGAIVSSFELPVDRTRGCHFPPFAVGRCFCALCGIWRL